MSYAGTSTDGSLTETDIAAIKAYVTEADLVATVETTIADSSFTVDNLPYGYYYITTTTGTVVTVDSTHPNAEVNDKNEIPPVDKKITGATSYDADGKKAIAEVGSVVEFEASIVKKNGAENYIFHDTMSTGLAYNNDVVVTVNGQPVSAGSATYTIGADVGDTFTVRFANEYIETLADETKIVFTYTATVTSDALQLDPANNTASLDFGDVNGENHTPPVVVEVYNAKISVYKTDDEDEPLANAEFVLKNSNDKYYSKDADGKIVWVDSIEDAEVHISDAEGNVPAFTGLANGTYTLVETKAPAGYNKGADVQFTINEHDYTAENLIKSATVINKEGPELPSTGGIGTTIFYVLGGLLVFAAAVVLIARRRASVNA